MVSQCKLPSNPPRGRLDPAMTKLKLLTSFALAMASYAGFAYSQIVPPPPSAAGGEDEGEQGAVVILQPPSTVVVDGKAADSLSDDEMRAFLESKIQTIHQSEGAVELLRVAPGYALTLSFNIPVSSVILGDPSLVKFSLQGRILVLSAGARRGDTSMQIVLPGDRILNYHVFISPNFVDAQSTLNIVVAGVGKGNAKGEGNPYVGKEGTLDIGAIASIISNYDALEQEGALNKRGVKRLPVFKKSDLSSFEYYYIYVFKDGPVAISFAYKNPFTHSIRYDESRLRLQMGNVLYIPDYVSFNNTELGPGDTSTGFAIVTEPAFVPNQPFELVWR
jgi:hypothetical protein